MSEYEEPNKKLAQTHVYHEGKCFFVSTIDRDSSSMLGGRYAETFVWEWDEENRKRLGFVGQGEGPQGSIRRHREIVDRLFRTGRFDVPEDEE